MPVVDRQQCRRRSADVGAVVGEVGLADGIAARRFALAAASLPRVLKPRYDGTAIASRMPMMMITTRSSIRVKPFSLFASRRLRMAVSTGVSPSRFLELRSVGVGRQKRGARSPAPSPYQSRPLHALCYAQAPDTSTCRGSGGLMCQVEPPWTSWRQYGRGGEPRAEPEPSGSARCRSRWRAGAALVIGRRKCCCRRSRSRSTGSPRAGSPWRPHRWRASRSRGTTAPRSPAGCR